MSRKDLNRSLVVANTIVDSQYFLAPELDLTMSQKQLVYYLMSLVDSTKDFDFHDETIRIKDYCHVFNMDFVNQSGNNRKWLINSLLDIAKKVFLLQMPDGSIEFVRWLDRINVNFGSGTLTLRLSESLKLYLLQLRKHFTKVQLLFLAQFRSKYASDLYLYCKTNEFKRKWYVSIEELRSCLLHGKENSYTRVYDFQTKILHPAIRSINENTDIIVVIEPMKKGVKIVNFAVRVRKKTKAELEKIPVYQAYSDPSKADELRQQMTEVLGDAADLTDLEATDGLEPDEIELISVGDGDFVRLFSIEEEEVSDE